MGILFPEVFTTLGNGCPECPDLRMEAILNLISNIVTKNFEKSPAGLWPGYQCSIKCAGWRIQRVAGARVKEGEGDNESCQAPSSQYLATSPASPRCSLGGPLTRSHRVTFHNTALNHRARVCCVPSETSNSLWLAAPSLMT